MKFISSLDWAGIETAQAASHSIWSAGFSLEERVQRLRHFCDDFAPKTLHLSGIKNTEGQLVCSVKRYALQLKIGGRSCSGMGVGALFTMPEFRRQGAAEFLLEKVAEEETDKGTQFILLFSEIGDSYYQELGFHLLHSESWSVDLTAGFDSGRGDISPFQASELYELKRKWQMGGDGFAPDFSLTQWQLLREINRVSGYRVVQSGSEILAGFSFLLEPGSVWIDDWTVNPNLPRAQHADIWKSVFHFFQKQQVTKAKGWVVPSPLPLGATIRFRDESIGMVRSLNGEHFQEEKIPSWFGRLDYF